MEHNDKYNDPTKEVKNQQTKNKLNAACAYSDYER